MINIKVLILIKIKLQARKAYTQRIHAMHGGLSYSLAIKYQTQIASRYFTVIIFVVELLVGLHLVSIILFLVILSANSNSSKYFLVYIC